MKREFNCFEAVFLALVVLLALFGVVQAAGPYQVVIVGDSPPHSSSVEVGPGKSIDMQIVILNVTDWPVAGSSLYLNYDPKVISNVSCVRSIFKEFNKCEAVKPGRFLFEGYDTFAKYTGDVVVEVLRITANASAPEGSSTTLRISGPRPGAVSGGTPVWGPFWQGIGDIPWERHANSKAAGDFGRHPGQQDRFSQFWCSFHQCHLQHHREQYRHCRPG